MSRTNPWLTYLDANKHARLRLFCFPYAGGAASLFSAWSKDLPSEVSVCPIQLPGRGSRVKEPPFTTLSVLIEAMVPGLRSLFDLPFAFFGHSMGALISFELARALRRQDAPSPVHLFFSGYRAPHLPDPDPPMHDLPEEAFIEELRELNGTPREILENRELMQVLLPLLRADASLCETYACKPGPPLDCPASVFGGLSDAKTSREELEQWNQHTLRPCKLRMLPGDHFFLHNRTLLLQALREDLEEILSSLRLAGQFR